MAEGTDWIDFGFMDKPYKDIVQCCGCGACSASCPKSAIKMTEDSKHSGAKYPIIDQNLCIDCGLCKRICKYSNPELVMPKSAFAGARKSDAIMQSASGGAFAALAEGVLNSGGVVFGCAMMPGDVSDVRIIKCENIGDLSPLLGSKYVYSKAEESYREVKEELAAGRIVLYSGLPCQVGGLLSYLRRPYDNLITVDIICHGAPSEAIFRSYIEYEERKRKSKIDSFRFRAKDEGWGLNYRMSMLDRFGNHIIECKPYRNSLYYLLFLASYFYRECCYECPYAGPRRVSDITIGDFWGVEQLYPKIAAKLNPERGISAIMANSDKGISALSKYGEDLELFQVKYEDVRLRNGQLNHPSRKPADYEGYIKAFNQRGWNGVRRHYYRVGRWPYLIKEALGILVKQKIMG